MNVTTSPAELRSAARSTRRAQEPRNDGAPTGGHAFLELVVCLPLFVLILNAMVQFGGDAARLLQWHGVVDRIARAEVEALRRAPDDGSTDASRVQRAADRLATVFAQESGLVGAALELRVWLADGDGGVRAISSASLGPLYDFGPPTEEAREWAPCPVENLTPADGRLRHSAMRILVRTAAPQHGALPALSPNAHRFHVRCFATVPP